MKNEASSGALHGHYVDHAKMQGVPRRAIETQLGIFLQKVVPNLHRSRKTFTVEQCSAGYFTETVEKRGLVYVFPSLKDCRQHFAALLNENITWEEGSDWG